MKHLSDFDLHGLSLPGIRHLAADCPWHWLRAGRDALKANPLPSLAYGLLFALGGDLIILAVLDHPHLLSVAISGFFLVAPLLAVGGMLTLFGFATLLFGLVVIMPILSHASWHAYRELVE